MRTQDITNKQINSMDVLMNQAQQADANIEGIKTVCAEVIQLSDIEVSIQFICTDGTQIKPIKQTGIWAGRTLNKLKYIWGLDANATFTDVQQACNDETQDVMFFERSGVNENGHWDMQDFRKPNAIDKGKVANKEITEHTNEVVKRDIEYRRMVAQAQAQKESEV